MGNVSDYRLVVPSLVSVDRLRCINLLAPSATLPAFKEQLMIRRVCLAICLFGFLIGDATVARADGPRGEPRATAASPFLLSRSLEVQGLQLARLTPAKSRRPWDATPGSTQTQLAKCESKKKGLIMGAVFGAAAGVAIGAVFVNAVSGGASNGDTQSIVYSGLAGAGVGALAGFAYCR
jgi:hypothetical protein